MSNGYDVEFDFGGPGLSGLKNVLKSLDISVPQNNDSGQPGSLINMFCDEAQLPNSSAATGQMTGRYLGEGTINYPHTRLVSDFSLTWLCDANMAPYKFITAWHNYIFGEFNDSKNKNFIKTPDSLKDFKNQVSPRPINRINRLKYPNEYQAILRVSKAEKGKNAPNSRIPLVYLMENVFPYSIDSVPLSYGTSQVTRVTANFYYTRHTVWYADVRKFDG